MRGAQNDGIDRSGGADGSGRPGPLRSACTRRPCSEPRGGIGGSWQRVTSISIDPTTGTATLIGPLVGFSSVSGMAFHPTTGVLYAVGFFNNDAHVLLTIDTATGAGTVVGPTNVASRPGAATGCRTSVPLRRHAVRLR